MRLTFKELKDEIAKIVPKSIDYKVSLEAGDIAIVTDVPQEFGGGDGLVGKIAKKIKRRIKIRPDPSIIKPEQEAKSIIESVIPEEAEISQIYFDGCFSEVIILFGFGCYHCSNCFNCCCNSSLRVLIRSCTPSPLCNFIVFLINPRNTNAIKMYKK